jgi:hypothetical protein
LDNVTDNEFFFRPIGLGAIEVRNRIIIILASRRSSGSTDRNVNELMVAVGKVVELFLSI